MKAARTLAAFFLLCCGADQTGGQDGSFRPSPKEEELQPVFEHLDIRFAYISSIFLAFQAIQS